MGIRLKGQKCHIMSWLTYFSPDTIARWRKSLYFVSSQFCFYQIKSLKLIVCLLGIQCTAKNMTHLLHRFRKKIWNWILNPWLAWWCLAQFRAHCVVLSSVSVLSSVLIGGGPWKQNVPSKWNNTLTPLYFGGKFHCRFGAAIWSFSFCWVTFFWDTTGSWTFSWGKVLNFENIVKKLNFLVKKR